MRIVSWNIQWGRGADGVVDLARVMKQLIEHGPPEVICLQEVACGVAGLKGLAAGETSDDLTRLAAAFPQHAAVFGAALDVAGSDGRRARFGNLILSRWPVLQVRQHCLPSLLEADARVPGMARNCVEVTLDAPGGPLRVLTTHLEYYSPRSRLAQAEALCARQREAAEWAAQPLAGEADGNPIFAPRPSPVDAVLCGDFNCEPDSPAYQMLATPAPHGWADAWRLAHGDAPHAPTVGLHGAEWPERPYCCDFVWLAGSLRERLRAIRVDAATAASDHQPLLVELAD